MRVCVLTANILLHCVVFCSFEHEWIAHDDGDNDVNRLTALHQPTNDHTDKSTGLDYEWCKLPS